MIYLVGGEPYDDENIRYDIEGKVGRTYYRVTIHLGANLPLTSVTNRKKNRNTFFTLK